MTVAHQFQAAIASGEVLDWQRLRDQLDQEHAGAKVAGEREALLALFKTLMDMVEYIDIAPDRAASFKADRQQSYHRLVLREASVGERVCLRTLDQVTTREVKAGRMPGDDPLRDAAVFAAVALHRDRAETPAAASKRLGDSGQQRSMSGTGWRKLIAWFARRGLSPIHPWPRL